MAITARNTLEQMFLVGPIKLRKYLIFILIAQLSNSWAMLCSTVKWFDIICPIVQRPDSVGPTLQWLDSPQTNYTMVGKCLSNRWTLLFPTVQLMGSVCPTVQPFNISLSNYLTVRKYFVQLSNSWTVYL